MERRAKEATSTIAVSRRTLMRSSDGIVEIGQGGWGDVSVGGSWPGIGMEEKEDMSSDIVEAGGPSGE